MGEKKGFKIGCAVKDLIGVLWVKKIGFKIGCAVKDLKIFHLY